ncbi:MAG: glycosyltransferase family 2 protein [Xanthomonadales bacterium]|nr:glycosyltransferase family 2 protein [Xanthomonadales bacterium]
MSAAVKPAVSVVMPLYNKADLVLEAIASVQAQDMCDWELLVVNDGSTDGGPEQVRAATVQDARIRLVTQPNHGVSSARNAGLSHATSEVVAFLDADDLWRPDFLTAVLALRERFPTARWWGTGYALWRDGAGTHTAKLGRTAPSADQSLWSNYFDVAAQSDPPICSSAVAVDRSTMLALGGFPQGIASGEDLLTWARLALAHPLAYDRRALAIFRVSGIERRPDPDDSVGRALAALQGDHPDTPGLAAYRAAWHRMRAAMWLRFDQTHAARGDAGKALRLSPWNSLPGYLFQC